MQLTSEMRLLEEITVTLESIELVSEIFSNKNSQYTFRYQISLLNNSQEFITFLGRKWIFKGGSGKCYVVEGEGIAGRKPTLAPGKEFRYQSFHVVNEKTIVNGSYFGITHRGDWIFVRIPSFDLITD